MTISNTAINKISGATTVVLMVHGIAEAAHAMNKFVPMFERLRNNYDHIILLGRSMGALLVLNESVRCSEKIQAVIAIATPLKINVT